MNSRIGISSRCATRISLICLSLLAFSCAGGAPNKPTAVAPASIRAIAATTPIPSGTASPDPRPRDLVLQLDPGKGEKIEQVMAPDRFRGYVWKDEKGLVYCDGEVNSLPFRIVGPRAEGPDGRVVFEMRGTEASSLLIQDNAHGAKTVFLVADFRVARTIELRPDSVVAVEYYDKNSNTRFTYIDHSGEKMTASAKDPAEKTPPQPSWKLSLPERRGFKNADHIDKGGLVAYTQFTVTGYNNFIGADILGGPCYFVLASESGSTSLGPYKDMGAVESHGEGKSAVFAFSADLEGQEGSYVVLAKADGSERRFGPYAQLIERPSLMPEGDAVFDSAGALYFAVKENGITRVFKDGEESLRCSRLGGIDFAEGYRFPGGDGSAVISFRPEGENGYYILYGDRRIGPFDSEPVHIMGAGGHWLVVCESSAYYDDRKLASGNKFDGWRISEDGTRYAIQVYGENSEYDCSLYFNGQEYGPFKKLSKPVFDPQLRSFVLQATDRDYMDVAVGPAGRSAPAWGISSVVAISPDATKAAWVEIQRDEVTKRKTFSIILDGVVLHELKDSADVFKLRFSSDGRVLAAKAVVEGRDRDMLFVDGELRTGSLSLDGKSASFVEGDAIVSISCGE